MCRAGGGAPGERLMRQSGVGRQWTEKRSFGFGTRRSAVVCWKRERFPLNDGIGRQIAGGMKEGVGGNRKAVGNVAASFQNSGSGEEGERGATVWGSSRTEGGMPHSTPGKHLCNVHVFRILC